MTKKAPRRSGVVVDREQLDYQLAIRGCTQRKLARLAGVDEMLVSRARNGHHITERTLRKITTALLKIPLQPGADLLVARPKTAISLMGDSRENGTSEKKKIATASTSVAIRKEVHAAATARTHRSA